MHAYRVGGDLSLDQYFARGKFPINYPRYTDPSGSRIIVDRVVRYENLTDELGEIFARLNVPFEGSLGVRKKRSFPNGSHTVSVGVQPRATRDCGTNICPRNPTSRLPFRTKS